MRMCLAFCIQLLSGAEMTEMEQRILVGSNLIGLALYAGSKQEESLLAFEWIYNLLVCLYIMLSLVCGESLPAVLFIVLQCMLSVCLIVCMLSVHLTVCMLSVRLIVCMLSVRLPVCMLSVRFPVCMLSVRLPVCMLSVRLTVCKLSVRLPVCMLSVCLPVCMLSVHLTVCKLSVCLIVCMLSVCLPVCMLSVCLPVCMLSVRLTVCMLSVRLTVCMLSVRLTVCMLSVRLPVCMLSVHLTVCMLSVCLTVCMLKSLFFRMNPILCISLGYSHSTWSTVIYSVFQLCWTPLVRITQSSRCSIDSNLLFFLLSHEILTVSSLLSISICSLYSHSMQNLFSSYISVINIMVCTGSALVDSSVPLHCTDMTVAKLKLFNCSMAIKRPSVGKHY